MLMKINKLQSSSEKKVAKVIRSIRSLALFFLPCLDRPDSHHLNIVHYYSQHQRLLQNKEREKKKQKDNDETKRRSWKRWRERIEQNDRKREELDLPRLPRRRAWSECTVVSVFSLFKRVYSDCTSVIPFGTFFSRISVARELHKRSAHDTTRRGRRVRRKNKKKSSKKSKLKKKKKNIVVSRVAFFRSIRSFLFSFFFFSRVFLTRNIEKFHFYLLSVKPLVPCRSKFKQ